MSDSYCYRLHNQCRGGKPFEDMYWDGEKCIRKKFCLGIEDAETDELESKCKRCPKLLYGDEWQKWANRKI